MLHTGGVSPPFVSSRGARPVLVLDTNTVMALWLFADPALAPLRAWLEAGRATLLSRADCLDELAMVLGYTQFGLAMPAREALLAAYRARLLLVEPTISPSQSLPRCRDADDQKFAETARDGHADYLLTRDKALLRLGRHRLCRELFETLTPEAFCQRLLGECKSA